MLRFAAAVLTASFLSVTPAFSHGELTHVLGTVSGVDANHLTVNTKTGETIGFRRPCDRSNELSEPECRKQGCAQSR